MIGGNMDLVFGLDYHSILYILAIMVFLNLLLFICKINLSFIVFLNIVSLFVVFIEPAPSDVLFVSLLIFAFRDKLFTLEKYHNMKWIIWFIAAYIIVATISMLYITDYLAGYRFWAITIYLVLYSIFIYFYSNEENYSYILLAYVLGSTIAAILGMVGYLGVFSEYLLFDQYRVKSLYKDPNVFGAFLIPTILILVGDIKSRRLFSKESSKKWQKVALKLIYITLIGINAVGLIVSFSRGAWVSFIGSITVLFILNLKKIDCKRAIIILCILIIILSITWFGLLSTEWKDFFLERLSFKEYDTDRFAVQKLGICLSINHVFGYGPGQYEGVVEKIIGEEYSAHSVYTRVILENGIIGFCFLVIPIGYLLVKLFKTNRMSDKSTQILSSILFSIMISLMINSLVIDTLHWRHLWLFYGLSMSFVSYYSIEERLKPKIQKGGSINKAGWLNQRLREWMRLKSKLYVSIRNILAFIGMIMSSLKISRNENKIIILMYHRVNDYVHKAMAVKKDNFLWQMNYLKRKNYKVISMNEAYDKMKRKSIYGKYIVLTFDDGYEDFYEYAFPVLQKYIYPSIIYLVPGYIDSGKSFPWDKDLDESNLMDWQQIKNLNESKLIDFGSHTLNHLNLDCSNSEIMRYEMDESRKIIEEKLSENIIHFAYPKGIYSKEAEKILKEFYKTAVLIFKGVNVNKDLSPDDVFKLKRMPIYRSDGKFMFIARLKGWIWIEEIIRKVLNR